MRHLLLIFAVVIAFGPGAWAADPLRDFNAALAAQKRGDHDLAVRYFSRVIGSGQLSNDNLAIVLNKRGNAHSVKGRHDKAFEDFDRAVGLDSKNAEAYNNRGTAFAEKHLYERAIADYDAALRLKPSFALALNNRGIASFHRGHFAKAVPDLAKFADMNPDNIYHTLWLFLAKARAGRDGKKGLARSARKFDLTTWPGKVIELFLGRATPADLEPLIRVGDAGARREMECEYFFYVGEYYLIRGMRDKAAGMFRRVIGTGVKGFVEYSGARSELKRIGS